MLRGTEHAADELRSDACAMGGFFFMVCVQGGLRGWNPPSQENFSTEMGARAKACAYTQASELRSVL